ncbi:hypothetical protein V7182_04085 [Neobacillus drentensis]|uniref:hypothetical protein n=1 Tax=Neobacillus drentensis TaxID=220684 RepID=UPI002FFF89DA
MKALSDEKIYEMCAPFVIGDARLLERAGKIVGNDARLKQIFSPDEAAFDIAGKGIADELSLKEAIRQAIELAPKRQV